jgi:hypothetical protein
MLSGGSIDDFESRARRVKDDAALRDRLVLNYVASREPYPLSPHIEERIYKGFPGQNDEARMAASIKPLGRITSRSCRASRMSGCGGSGFTSFTSKHAHSFPRSAVGGRGPLGGSTCRRRHRLPYLRAGFGRDGEVAVGGSRRGWPSGSVPPLSSGAERASSRVPGSAGRRSLGAV